MTRIIQALNECLDALPRQQLQRVRGIGVSGQMHGILFWKAGQGCEWMEGGPAFVFEPRAVSHLVTWQDGRCNSSFLASLPKPDSHLSVATGFGCATIFWLLKNSPEFLKSYDAAGTIQDYVVAMLCGLPRPLMSDQNAASWGYFNTQSQSWNLDTSRTPGPCELTSFRVSILSPEVQLKAGGSSDWKRQAFLSTFSPTLQSQAAWQAELLTHGLKSQRGHRWA